MGHIPEIDSGHLLRSRRAFFDTVRDAERLILEDPARLATTRNALVADGYFYLAMYDYALDEPLDSIRKELSCAVEAYFKVLESRGTEPILSSLQVHLDASARPINPLIRSASGRQVDFSIGNSARTYDFCAAAFLSQARSSVQHLAGKIWDPPNAPYVRWDSIYCTPNQQAIAYAFRELARGADEDGLSCLQNLREERLTELQRNEVLCLRGVAKGNESMIGFGIEELLNHHCAYANQKQNRNDPDAFVCKAAVNTSALCLQRNLMPWTKISSTPYLPVEMLKG